MIADLRLRGLYQGLHRVVLLQRDNPQLSHNVWKSLQNKWPINTSLMATTLMITIYRYKPGKMSFDPNLATRLLKPRLPLDLMLSRWWILNKELGRHVQTGKACENRLLVESRHHEEQSCDINYNLDQWFGRRSRLKDFLSRALAALVFSGAEPFMQFW